LHPSFTHTVLCPKHAPTPQLLFASPSGPSCPETTTSSAATTSGDARLSLACASSAGQSASQLESEDATLPPHPMATIATTNEMLTTGLVDRFGIGRLLSRSSARVGDRSPRFIAASARTIRCDRGRE
jgi:hypothetical protein